MAPHYIEALIGGLASGVPLVIAGWLLNRDTKTRLVLKSEEHDKDISALQTVSTDHEKRIVRLETFEETR